MNNIFSKTKILMSLLPLLLLSACEQSMCTFSDISVVYSITTAFSLLTLIGYFLSIKKKDIWFIILFISVFVVNAGYFVLSISPSLNIALWANRVSYLGSVFLPLSIIMIILNVSGLRHKKILPFFLFAISFIVFLIAASQGYLPIYYKSVTLENINGASVLNKEYGPFHILFLFYLLSYFSLMIAVALYAVMKKKIGSPSHSVILILSVFVNICVWLLEQLVEINFEFLSISYIITELFLISVYIMIQRQEALVTSLQAKLTASVKDPVQICNKNSPEFAARCKFITEQLPTLTASERNIYNHYLNGMSTKELLNELNISENTLKFHNKNLYSKLGVSSRKELIEYARAISTSNSENKR